MMATACLFSNATSTERLGFSTTHSASKKDILLVDSLNKLSTQFRKKNDTLAIDYGNRALELAKHNNYTKGEADACFNLGIAFKRFAKTGKAIEQLNKALVKYKELGTEKKIATCYNSLGILYKTIGDYEKAMRHYQTSLKLKEALGDKNGMARTLNNIGIIHMDQEQFKSALEYYDKSLKIKQELKDEKGIAFSYSNIGNVYLNQEKYKKALEYHQYGLEIRERIKDQKNLASSYFNLGLIYLKTEVYDKAMHFFQLANTAAKNGGELIVAAFALNGIGAIHLKKGHPEEALPYATEALELSKKINGKTAIRESYQLLSEAYYELGEYKTAREYYYNYFDIKDSLLNEENFRQINELELRYDTEKKEQQLQVKNAQLKQNESEIKQKNAKVEQQKTFNYFLVFLIVIAIVIAFLLFSRYKLAQRNKQGQLEKTNLEIEQRLLRAQMNPHFIFNSLNSIQSFISENEANIAERYLSKFARLMRYILDNSSKPYISLDAEVNTLQLYMELERLRFDNKFDFHINVASDIDTEELAIPPMLAQPYIENAILHGMMYKEEKGNITIDFTCENDLVHCIIKDDGIGRKKAMEIKSKTTSAHQSRGMQVTKDRIDLMNQQKGAGIQVNITDLENENNTALGTLIELVIPTAVL
jgi:tetratricopeptide (TPR) repeat protein